MTGEKRARAPNGSPELRRYSSAAKSPTITHRVRGGLYEKLKASAEKREVSLSEEIERRLEASFQSAADPYLDTALRMVGVNCAMVQHMLGGRSIAEDAYVRAACARAAASAIDFVGGLAGRDAAGTVALLQADAEKLGQLVAMFTEAAVRNGPEDEFAGGLHAMAAAVAAPLREHADQQARGAELAHALREGAYSGSAARPATPDELVGMAPPAQDPGEPSTATAPKRSRAKTRA